MKRCSVLATLLWVLAGASAAGGPPEPRSPGLVLPEGDEATEQWDLAAHFESGHRLYARFLVTNAGPGEHTALAFGHLLRPDGPPVEFRNGRRQGRWQLSDDRRRLTIGSSVLVLGEEARHFEVDNDKRGIKIHLDFRSDPTQAAPKASNGYRLELLNLATPARGRFWLEGMAEPQPLTGHALLSHTGLPRAEGELLARRIDLAGFDPEARLFVSEILAPDGSSWRWGIAGDGPIRDLTTSISEVSGAEYPIPTAIGLRGKNLDGRISLGKTLLELNPTDALPTLVRMVYSFGGRPRHLWVEADADVGLKSPDENAVLRYQGEGIAILVYPDRFPPKDR